MSKAIVIPMEGPLYEVELSDNGDGVESLGQLQEIVGGHIEAVNVPEFIDKTNRTTAYVNEEGKFDPECKPNMRATDFMVPGVGLFWGDFIAGNFVLVGFNPSTGGHLDVPKSVVDRARLIEREAG